MNSKQLILFTLSILIILYVVLQVHNERQSVNIFVINLDRSYMRKYSITAQMILHGMQFNRFSAINGSSYNFNKGEQKLLSGILNESDEILSGGKNKTSEEIEKTRRGVMACALSHITLWKQNIGLGPILILEDDVILYLNFKKYLNIALQEIWQYDPDWHILWISGEDPGSREVVSRFYGRSIYRMDPPEYIGQGAMGYILSNKGIQHFTQQLEERGCFCGIDIFLLKALDIRHSYGTYKPLVFADFFNSTL
jgi:GR25 family glycosyltransferase involved in LPS biosynthesis